MVIAQTFPQLLNEVEQGYGLDQAKFIKINLAYSFLQKTFSNYYRPSGKSFISHLIGTASLAIKYKLDFELVIIALLHSIYSHKNYNYSNELKNIIGLSGVNLLKEYSTSNFYSCMNNNIIILKLINELEELLNYDICYFPKPLKRIYRVENILLEIKNNDNLMHTEVIKNIVNNLFQFKELCKQNINEKEKINHTCTSAKKNFLFSNFSSYYIDITTL